MPSESNSQSAFTSCGAYRVEVEGASARTRFPLRLGLDGLKLLFDCAASRLLSPEVRRMAAERPEPIARLCEFHYTRSGLRKSPQGP